jgi:hypothetical protein
MKPRLNTLLTLLLLAATACTTEGGARRSGDAADTGSRIVLIAEGAPLRVVRPPALPVPVEVTQAEYEAAMVRFAIHLRDQLPPRPEKRLEIISWGSPEERTAQDKLVQEYLHWCEERGTPGDCWNVLKDQRSPSDEAKRDLAFALATEGIWLGTAAVIDEVLDPVQLQLAIMLSLTTTMTLLAIPEPISKLIVISLTLSLVAYVGWDTLAGIIEGWRRMDAEARRARTFSELRQAGRRFGQVLGEKVTRLLILAATAALGSAGGAGLSGGGAQLPQLAQASRMATAQGLPIRVVGQVKTVKVTGRVLTVSMEPSALLMANQGMSNAGGGDSPPSAPAPASKYRLTSIESWRKPRFTEDGRLLPFKNTREPASPIPNLGRDRAGKTIAQGEHTLRFDKDGFPEFDTKFEHLLESSHIGSGRFLAHRKASNEKLFAAIEKDPSLAKTLGLSRPQIDDLLKSDSAPPGYVWHHHQDVGRMQLVSVKQHRLANPHTGGMAIWGGRIFPMTLAWRPYLWKEHRPVPPEAFEALERRWGLALPEDYKQILSSHQGMIPQPSGFNVGKALTSMSALLTLTEHEQWPEYSIIHTYEDTRHYIPDRVYPFAVTPGGEFLCFDYRASPHQPKVVFVTVEGELHPVADSFTEFLSKLHD